MIDEPLRDRTEARLRPLLQPDGAGNAAPQPEGSDVERAADEAPHKASRQVLLAREVLVLLRDPSASMIKAGVRTITGLQPTPEAMAQTLWQRMIDAALDEMK